MANKQDTHIKPTPAVALLIIVKPQRATTRETIIKAIYILTLLFWGMGLFKSEELVPILS
jgi:hypothetical protein